MTVVVAFVGADGAILASDSEATESGHTRYDVEKIWTCGGLLCGYTGNGSVKDRLAKALEDAFLSTFPGPLVDRMQARDSLQQIFKPVLQHVYSTFVPAGPGQHHGMLAGSILILGRDDAGYWLLEIDGSNNASFYTDKGFHTVGSGSSAAYVAHALMEGYDIAARDVQALRLVAYRTVDNCIKSLGGRLGVGGHVQLWESRDGAPFMKCEGDELDSVKDGVDTWITIERESLDKVVEGNEAETPAKADPPVRLADEEEKQGGDEGNEVAA